MATGAASQLAGPVGLAVLARPLLGVAIAQAVVIPLAWLWAHRSRRWAGVVARAGLRPPADHLGAFTVAIGLGVIGTGLAAQPGGAALAGAVGTGVLGWGATVWLTAALVVPLVARPPGPGAVDGTWFLAPAAFLAGTVVATALQSRAGPGGSPELGWLGLAGVAVGVVGYAVALALAGWRLAAAGLAGTTWAPWWIAAGCGGLAAAAAGRAAGVAPAAGTPGAGTLGWVALAAWAVGSALLVPVVAASAAALWRRRRLGTHPPWPPTFSTAVYALGADQVGRLHHLHRIAMVGEVAGATALALWAGTAVLHALRGVGLAGGPDDRDGPGP